MSYPNEIDIYVGARIRRIREFRGIARSVVADALAVSSTQVGIIERGLTRLTPEQMLVIATVLNVRPSFLFGTVSLRADADRIGMLLPLFNGLIASLLEDRSA